jgi:hypothetical protein
MDEIFQHEAESVSDLVNRIAEVYRPQGKRGTIAVTCSPFIPKPHTPWEGWPMASEKQLKHLDKILRNRLGKLPRAKYQPFGALEALLQGVLSQGDQSLAPFLIEVTRHPENLRTQLRETLRKSLVRLQKHRWNEEPPPWDFVKL